MNLMKTSRTLAAIAFATLGFAFPAQATITTFFSTTSDCLGTNSTSFSTGGTAVPMSLCMTTTTEATCGHTIVLQAATAGESGKFIVTSNTLGAAFTDPNSDVVQLPLAINSPPIVADLGGTGSAPAPAAANRLLTTFNFAPQAGATNASYVISLNSVSIVATDADGTCGVTTVPGEAPISASFTLTRSAAPVFTSASSTTFSTASANTFAVTATGIPTPTITAGALPAGVSFVSGGVNSGTGTLSTANGTFTAGTITFTATSGAATQPQTFTLSAAAQATQTINFTNPGAQTFSASVIPLSASAVPSGLPITFSSTTTAVCTVTGSNVTMVALGTCSITATQAGNATYLPATASVSFGIVGGVPGAPVIGAATSGNGQATIAFTAPASSGGSVITAYTATCSGGASVSSGTGNSSPITVSSLTNTQLYSCTVTATNALGTGPASAPVTVTPAVVPLSVVGVVSRKVHGTAGTFSLPLTTGVPIAGAVTIESRLVGAGHTIVFQFSEAITSAGTASAVDGLGALIATNAPTFAGNEVTVVLPTVADKTRVGVTLANVNGTGLGVTFVITVGFLAGDQDGSGTVNNGDISVIRARSGQTANSLNFRGDFNASGAIESGDISTVRARSGNSLP